MRRFVMATRAQKNHMRDRVQNIDSEVNFLKYLKNGGSLDKIDARVTDLTTEKTRLEVEIAKPATA